MTWRASGDVADVNDGAFVFRHSLRRANDAPRRRVRNLRVGPSVTVTQPRRVRG